MWSIKPSNTAERLSLAKVIPLPINSGAVFATNVFSEPRMSEADNFSGCPFSQSLTLPSLTEKRTHTHWPDSTGLVPEKTSQSPCRSLNLNSGLPSRKLSV